MAPYSHELAVRYRDLDTRGHVNHAVYVTYLEGAKIGFFASELDVSLDRARTVVRSLDIDYRRSIAHGERVVVTVAVEALGTTSYTLGYGIHADDELAASAETVSVLLDESGSPRELPEAWRESLEASKTD